AGGGAGAEPVAGAGGAGAGGCADCACDACVEKSDPSCADAQQACRGTLGCITFDSCARQRRCLDATNFLTWNACVSDCTAATAAVDADLNLWLDHVRCAACVPGCADACPATKPLCSVAGAGGAGGASGAAGLGGEGGVAGLGGAGGVGGAGGAGGGGQLNECGACVVETGPALCPSEFAACAESSGCNALDACLRDSCLTQPLDLFPVCALSSCGPFLLNPTALDLWNRYAQCSICDTACYATCQPWSETLCLLDGDAARSLLGAPAPAALACVSP
ncbi:MAG TPA: hypothetical protein VFS00_13900, partial [Polyangiaceae bacterium]|nr:hypothetical protein [Polyangiaceae bacterium]